MALTGCRADPCTWLVGFLCGRHIRRRTVFITVAVPSYLLLYLLVGEVSWFRKTTKLRHQIKSFFVCLFRYQKLEVAFKIYTVSFLFNCFISTTARATEKLFKFPDESSHLYSVSFNDTGAAYLPFSVTRIWSEYLNYGNC